MWLYCLSKFLAAIAKKALLLIAPSPKQLMVQKHTARPLKFNCMDEAVIKEEGNSPLLDQLGFSIFICKCYIQKLRFSLTLFISYSNRNTKKMKGYTFRITLKVAKLFLESHILETELSQTAQRCPECYCTTYLKTTNTEVYIVKACGNLQILGFNTTFTTSHYLAGHGNICPKNSSTRMEIGKTASQDKLRMPLQDLLTCLCCVT